MAKKRLSGTHEGFSKARDQARKKCSREMGEFQGECWEGVMHAHSAAVAGKDMQSAHDACAKTFEGLPAEKSFCSGGVGYFRKALERLPASLAGLRSDQIKTAERRSYDHCSWEYAKKGTGYVTACRDGIASFVDELRHESPKLEGKRRR